MHAWIIALALVAVAADSPLPADERNAAPPERYHVEPVKIPAEDLSGDLGPRLLKLLSHQVSRNLQVMRRDRRAAGIEDPDVVVSDSPYFEYFFAGTAYAAATLLRFGEPDETMAGLSREELTHRAVRMIEAVARDHRLGGGKKQWSTFRSARIIHTLGMAAWLLWDELDPSMQMLVAQIIEQEADRYLGRPAPAQLVNDTQAESNAWTGGGIAVAACMFKDHPHREQWLEKAGEYMISAFATADDVTSGQPVDGKPLRQWLTAPNAFPDYTVENHGLVHPDYLGAISEMVRCAISFRLAGETVPQAVTFNGERIVDLLVMLYLPDGTLLYPQNTDYTPRRLDVFLQAGNLIPLRPDPTSKACLLRSLASIESMAMQRPDQPMNGWIGFPYDLGSTWGLTQNYLMFRFFGDGGNPVPDEQLERTLAGVFASEHGKFAVHRTPHAISSFSWRTTGKQPLVMGLTMPLDQDVLCYPMPWSYVGQVRELAAKAQLRVHSHLCAVRDDGFAILLELGWCSGKVRQNCAFVSLPDGRTVYLEERHATTDVTIDLATSGNVTWFDDPRWIHQKQSREWFAESGRLKPAPGTVHHGSWLNVDDRLGYVVVTSQAFRLFRAPGRPCIWRGDGTMYHTCRLEYVPFENEPGEPVASSYEGGQRIGRFGVVTCPGQTKEATASLAHRINRTGWQTSEDGVLALRLDRYLVYANFSPETKAITDGERTVPLTPETAGWLAH